MQRRSAEDKDFYLSAALNLRNETHGGGDVGGDSPLGLRPRGAARARLSARSSASLDLERKGRDGSTVYAYTHVRGGGGGGGGEYSHIFFLHRDVPTVRVSFSGSCLKRVYNFTFSCLNTVVPSNLLLFFPFNHVIFADFVRLH